MSSIEKKTEQKKSNKIDREPNSRFIVYKDKIIKVLEETTVSYTGFDVFTEMPFLIRKNKDAIHLPEAIITLIGCEKSRLRLADSMSDTRGGVSKLLGMSERNLYRCYKMHNMFPDDLICDDGKISTKMKIIEKPKKVKVKMLSSGNNQKLITEGKKGIGSKKR